jgi:succinate dehydrogenase / fumarate reductase cytochrome b subunit
MISVRQYLQSSLGRKWLMAITGLVLVLFVMGHMLGNLLIYLGPDALNAYAYKLHSIPDPIMTLIRLSLLLAVGVHIWMAVLLTLENKKAKPQGFTNKVKSTYASRTMRMSGIILLSFIIFHILHYTVRVVPTMEYNDNAVFSKMEGNSYSVSKYVPLYKEAHPVVKHGEPVQTFNVYDMLIHGFKNPFVSFFYILSVGLLCMHLAHGISSLFQTFGLRNTVWRVGLDRVALIYGLIVFIGFASIPLAVLTGVGGLDYSWNRDKAENIISQSIELHQPSSD